MLDGCVLDAMDVWYGMVLIISPWSWSVPGLLLRLCSVVCSVLSAHGPRNSLSLSECLGYLLMCFVLDSVVTKLIAVMNH